jgi:hypothetical protein
MSAWHDTIRRYDKKYYQMRWYMHLRRPHATLIESTYAIWCTMVLIGSPKILIFHLCYTKLTIITTTSMKTTTIVIVLLVVVLVTPTIKIVMVIVLVNKRL